MVGLFETHCIINYFYTSKQTHCLSTFRLHVGTSELLKPSSGLTSGAGRQYVKLVSYVAQLAEANAGFLTRGGGTCLLYTSPSPRDS